MQRRAHESTSGVPVQWPVSVVQKPLGLRQSEKIPSKNFRVGSAVCMGERGENTGTDRNTDYNHNIFNWAKISSITNVTVSETEYVALNLEFAEKVLAYSIQ